MKYFFRVVIYQIISKLQELTSKTDTRFDDHIIDLIKGIHPRTYDYIAFYLGAKTLVIGENIVHVLDAILTALIIFQVVISCNDIAAYILRKVLHVDENTTQQDDKTVFDGLILLIKIIL